MHAAVRSDRRATATNRQDKADSRARSALRSRRASVTDRDLDDALRKAAALLSRRRWTTPRPIEHGSILAPPGCSTAPEDLQIWRHQDAYDDARPSSKADYYRTLALSNASGFTAPGVALSNDSGMSKPAALMTLGERLKVAIKAEGRDGEVSQNEFERQAGLKRGQLSTYARGKRGGSTIAVDKLRALADVLHVSFDWLAWGEGPMRKGGRDTTPAEEAIVLARRSGTREEAIQSAWERFRDREASMTPLDWAVAIHTEAQLLGRPALHSVTPIDTTEHPGRVDRPRKTPPARPGEGR